MSALKLIVDIRSYWHPGGGRGQGMVLDAITHRDSAGLPVLPGRHVKGLIRDALERAESWGWDGYGQVAECLFGGRTENSPRGDVPRAGCLRVSDAQLPQEVAHYLATGDGKALVPGLYCALYATAVEHESAVARDQSLRGVEVVVPLRLEALIQPIAGREPPEDWQERLSGVLPLIEAVGAHRNRGLGRAQLSLEEPA
jgi:hypothetical protein